MGTRTSTHNTDTQSWKERLLVRETGRITRDVEVVTPHSHRHAHHVATYSRFTMQLHRFPILLYMLRIQLYRLTLQLYRHIIQLYRLELELYRLTIHL